MKTMKSVMLLVAVIQLSSASGSVVSASQDLDRSLGRVRVRVTRAVPRHQCRRALRNLEEFLHEVSRHIYDVSGGADLVTNFDIELPPNWRNTECTASIDVSEGQIGLSPDLEVTGSHPLLGDTAHAHQHGGCGVPGQKVDIPFPVLTETVELSQEALTATLLEVTRWRYGVFSETGSDGDSMYPLHSQEGEERVENLGCSRKELEEGRGLCPLMSYDKVANTKQNLLCGRISARRAILNQFSSQDGAEFVKPELRFVMPLDTKRVILILDQGASMATNWKSVLASTFQFINSLREGTELAILSFRREATLHLKPTRVEGGNREGLHYRIPRRLPSVEDDPAEMESCLDCAIEMASELATNTTTILLLSSYVYSDSKNNSKLMEFEQAANPILHRLVFGSEGGTHQHIHNNVLLINEHQNTLNITSQLSLALATLNDYPSQKFHHEVLPMQDLEGSFSVESSLSSDLWLQLLVQDTTEINTFEISSPSGQVFSFPKFDAGLVYFSLRGPRETGVWSYKIKLYPGHSQDRVSSLVLECWAAGTQSQVQLRGWTSQPTSADQPVIIYAQLEQDQVPVQGGEVEAVVRQVGRAEGSRVRLVDSGSGYPDITRGDGIYSGYFTQFTGQPGIYSVHIEAVNNSTASVVNTNKLHNKTRDFSGSSAWPLEPSVPLESFRRFTAAPSVYISHGSQFYISSSSVQKKDVFPPNRITDFRLTNYFNNSLFVTLSWTSPGDDFTLGKAFRYEIRCFTAQEALSEENFGEQGILIHSSLVPSPEPAGTEQRCTVGVPWPNEVFYYSIVAFDSAGNRGEVSNSIAVYVEEPITTTTEPSTIKFSNMKDVSATLPLKSFIQSESLMYIIAGIISLILIIIVIILTVIIRRLGGCRKKNDPSSRSVPDSSPPSLPDLCHDQSSYTRNSVSYISGYDLPEMLDYALGSPQKPGAQQLVLGRRQESSEESQYLGMNTSSVYQSPAIRTSLDINQYTLATNKRSNTTQTKYTAGSRVESDTVPQSPSISPVNSNYSTAAGQSTDCSVSVSGSDHELISESVGLQVVVLPPPVTETGPRPEPKPRKIPPAVPNKTVHASLV